MKAHEDHPEKDSVMNAFQSASLYKQHLKGKMALWSGRFRSHEILIQWRLQQREIEQKITQTTKHSHIQTGAQHFFWCFKIKSLNPSMAASSSGRTGKGPENVCSTICLLTHRPLRKASGKSPDFSACLKASEVYVFILKPDCWHRGCWW